MADINVERKSPSIWPWVIGLLVLALLIWAIAEMVDTDEEFEETAVVEEVEEVEEPAAVPAPVPVAPEAEAVETVEVEQILPIGPEDRGVLVEIEGTVVGNPTPEGFWVRTADDNVLFVKSDQPAATGADVDAVFGVLTPVPEGQAAQWADRANLATTEDWDVQRDLYIDTTLPEAQRARPPAAAPAQPTPTPTPQPGDTVRGRY